MPPYEVSADLVTLGRDDVAGRLPAGITAHPKVDAVTGETLVFRYDVTAPFLTWAAIAPDGTVRRPPTAIEGIEEAYMIHDFAISTRYLVFVLGPLPLDVDAMLAGGDPLVWKPNPAPAWRSSPVTARRCVGARRRLLGLARRQRRRRR